MEDMRSMQPTGNADKDFASMMEYHHAQAVQTQAYLNGAMDPQLKAWARKLLNRQRSELQELQLLDVASASARRGAAQQR